jgi:hypothetical protein
MSALSQWWRGVQAERTRLRVELAALKAKTHVLQRQLHDVKHGVRQERVR